MKLLDAMNEVLPKLQAPTVSSTSSTNPMANKLKSAIDNERYFVLSQDWWFNAYDATLPLDSDGKLDTPENASAIYDLTGGRTFSIRGDYVFDMTNQTYVFDAAPKVHVVCDMEFADLPFFAARLVLYRAAYSVYCSRFDAADGTAQVLKNNGAEALSFLTREHLRQKKFGVMKSGAGARLMNLLRG